MVRESGASTYIELATATQLEVTRISFDSYLSTVATTKCKVPFRSRIIIPSDVAATPARGVRLILLPGLTRPR